MAQTQNYEVYYDIKVNATEGTEQVTAFANAVEKLSKGRISFAPVVTNINEMMQAVEKTFRGKNGKKKDFNFDLEIRTGETEKRLEGVKNLLTEIKELTQGIKLTINPGEKIDGRALRNQANKLVGKKKLDRAAGRGETECRFGSQECHGHPADGYPFHRQNQLGPRSFRERT